MPRIRSLIPMAAMEVRIRRTAPGIGMARAIPIPLALSMCILEGNVGAYHYIQREVVVGCAEMQWSSTAVSEVSTHIGAAIRPPPKGGGSLAEND
ncbi:MAG: hypothetical protein U9Q82_03400 [Chloroflexota bacterium]|nr:hypothetical protein [Chloroflexota bacterium]